LQTPFTNNDDERVDGVTEADPATETVNSLRLSLKFGMMLLKESTAIISTGTLSPAAIFWGILNIEVGQIFPAARLCLRKKIQKVIAETRKNYWRQESKLASAYDHKPPCKE